MNENTATSPETAAANAPGSEKQSESTPSTGAEANAPAEKSDSPPETAGAAAK